MRERKMTYSTRSISTASPLSSTAAKSLESCPTLCDPIDSSPPGSPIPGILQAGTLEWVTISFSNAWKWKVKVKSLSCVRPLATPWTAAYQAPPSMGFSRQEYWSGVTPSHKTSYWWSSFVSILWCLLNKITVLGICLSHKMIYVSFIERYFFFLFCFWPRHVIWISTGRTDAEAETPILWPPDAKNWLIRKDPDAGKVWRWEEKGTTEDEMAGWHHQLNGYEFEWTPGVSDGQGGLACCSPWGHKESETTERLNWCDMWDLNSSTRDWTYSGSMWS